MKFQLTLLILFLTGANISFAQPTITDFTPKSAAPGMVIRITGTGLGTASSVRIGGVNASFTISSGEILATTPVTVSGDVSVTNPGGTVNRSGFIYVPTSSIITDFGGYWRTTAASPIGTQPDNSHNLLAFTHNGVTYSTGVNNSVLTNNGISFTSSVFKALPVASISGTATGSGSTYLALASRVDGSAATAYVAGATKFTIKESLIDGANGLDLGTGVTNLPSTAVMTFQIYNIDPTRATDAEPDLILTQIASPSSSNDEFTFLDQAGNPVGTSFTQDMTLLPRLGTYVLDLFSLATGIPYNAGRPYGVPANSTNTTRDIRVVSLNLSSFGINASNAGSVRALRITPSGNSDYAFIAYNAASVNLPPNAALSPETSVSSICPGGTASLEIIGTPAAGGTLSYSWEESTNGGTTWTAVTDGGNYSGATTSRLRIANATVANRYRASVFETGNGNAGISGVFIITAAAGTRVTSLSIAGGTTVCSNNNVQLTSTITGGSGLVYQWQSDASGSFQDVPGANTGILVPPVNQTGTVNYRLNVSPGSGCPGDLSGSQAITVTGISSTTAAERCQTGSVTLNATATSGTVSWYSAESGGSALATSNSYTIPSLASTTTYYAAAPGCTQRAPVIATVYPASAAGSVTTIPGSAPNTTVLTLASHTGQVLRWQSSTDNFTSSIQNIGSTQAQLVVTNPVQATRYRAVVQSGTCASVNSSASTAVVLPIRANSLKLTSTSNGAVLLNWETYDQEGATAYEVERATDGNNFSKLASVSPNPTLKYQWQDDNPGSGALLYRVKEVRLNGETSYSNTAFIRISNHGLLIYPNPVTDGKLKLQVNDSPTGRYTIQLHNSTGQAVYNGTFNYPGGVFQHSVTLPGKLVTGVYRMIITDPEGKRTNASVVIQ
ncbi:T9SS type A sorting domain-containing protein [Terrimonas sp. NA20]|uniref:T9SS type A sorting domain-containing protein n=1 Tax=Terrimonas ginsenosidimutans TaxID=2908004 RepID=A0ABS9KT21_9BACT|nr:T9SS type A sorting domain-containing protein [Terrimonas ginsenosidimutans]MCG2615468.1 T9SS type A sorting domain-containing protein [Terrimonas ginsenosidimutans]